MLDYDDKFHIMEWCAEQLRQMREFAVRRHDLALAERDWYLAQLASRKAREILAESPLVLAIATTGLRPYSDQIVEIVLMDRDRNVAYRQIVKSKADMHPKAQQYHGHTTTSLKSQPTFAEIVGDYAAAVDGRRLIAWSGGFERNFVRCECKRAGLDPAVVPVPRGRDKYANIELDSIQRLASEVTGVEYEPHGSKDRTPFGVATTVWDRLEKLAEEPREVVESDFDAYL